MTIDEFAARFHNREYPFDVSQEEAAELKAAGMVVAHGLSDDLLAFQGAIYEEIGAYEGTTVYLNKNGLITNECGNEDCPYHLKDIEKGVPLELLWDASPDYSWTFQAPFPFAGFDILDDGELFCRGIVFALADINQPQPETN